MTTMKHLFNPKSLQQRQQLCKELEGICREDYSVLETVIDDLVSRLDDNEMKEYDVLIGSIVGEDCMEEFIPGFHD